MLARKRVQDKSGNILVFDQGVQVFFVPFQIFIEMWNILCGGRQLLLKFTFIFGKAEMVLGPKNAVDQIWSSLKMNLDLARDLPFKDGSYRIHPENVVKKGRNL
jgi:hypothetical protein